MLPIVIAVVDIGSNSVKVLVAKMQHGVMEEIHLDAETTSLARGLPQTGKISDESMSKTLATLERFQNKLNVLREKHPNLVVKIVATAAMREASNAQGFAKKIENVFSQSITILSGIEEAEFALRGAMTARPDTSPEEECLFADLGGASTEIGFSKPDLMLVSTSLGALKTHNALGLGGEPISNAAWKDAHDYVWSILENEIPLELKEGAHQKNTFIAVGGTIVMATMALGLKPFRPACFEYKRSSLEDFADKLRKIGELERSQIPNLRRDRADILPFGIMLLTQMMKYLGQENGISTVRGLRHGLAMELLINGKP